MATGLSMSPPPLPLTRPITKPTFLIGPVSFLTTPPNYRHSPLFRSLRTRTKERFGICFVLEERKLSSMSSTSTGPGSGSGEGEGEGGSDRVTVVSIEDGDRRMADARLVKKLARKKSERFTYLVAAVMSSFGVTSLAIMAVYYRFHWQMEGGEVPVTEMLGTFALSVGAAVGMEFWARWAHRVLWHASLWHMHESHHKPREGPFELNDVFAIINAVPAIALLNYGFFHKGLVPGLCFGAGLGITVFGMAYMFVHDGLVHKRFPVGPIADVPYFRKVAAAHQLHHTEKFNGVPYGLFLGPRELEEVGGVEELEKEINRRIKLSKGPDRSR
ncbi:beta-carotene hydroxylase 2, chloroplastic-like [Silene latifolia]|uniref:beta-carotene hydroxylase 2, chloroplastic-like n=1 Tax=Silene latifolia TaxID=37657 RepID=UPI003D787D5F